jgi:hypothetical protein
MLKLTLRCYRCGKEVERDITNIPLTDDMIRNFGFEYSNLEGKNVLICKECATNFYKLQEELKDYVYKKECEFFKTCEGKGKNGNKRNSGRKKNERR